MEMPEGLLVFHSEFEKGTLRPKDPFQTEKIFFSADPISKELSEELFPFGDMATQEFNLGKEANKLFNNLNSKMKKKVKTNFKKIVEFVKTPIDKEIKELKELKEPTVEELKHIFREINWSTRKIRGKIRGVKNFIPTVKGKLEVMTEATINTLKNGDAISGIQGAKLDILENMLEISKSFTLGGNNIYIIAALAVIYSIGMAANLVFPTILLVELKKEIDRRNR